MINYGNYGKQGGLTTPTACRYRITWLRNWSSLHITWRTGNASDIIRYLLLRWIAIVLAYSWMSYCVCCFHICRFRASGYKALWSMLEIINPQLGKYCHRPFRPQAIFSHVPVGNFQYWPHYQSLFVYSTNIYPQRTLNLTPMGTLVINCKLMSRARSQTVCAGIVYRHFFGRLEIIPPLLSGRLPYRYAWSVDCQEHH